MLRRWFLFSLAAIGLAATVGQQKNELRFCLRSEPRTLNPLLVDDDSSETIRYLTGGVLIRMNRVTQALEPALAASWKVSPDGRQIRFKLRTGVRFSDGSPFDAQDVAYTMTALMNPDLHSPTGDAFRTGSGTPQSKVYAPDDIAILFPEPVASLPRLFDQVAILSSRSKEKEAAVLGPFRIAEHVSGSHLYLVRNPNYWKRDAQGRRLPYLDSLRIQIQPNRDLEALALTRGEIDLVAPLDPILFDKLQKQEGLIARDAGPSLDSEFLWFNQTGNAAVPDYKRDWFRSKAFRNAVSLAINRQDLAATVYRGHAQASVGPFPPSNKVWFNTSLKPRPFDPAAAKKLLAGSGFRYQGTTLVDAGGHPVSFSIVTNSGSKTRERLATLIQRDLAAIGIEVTVATLDFPGLLARITRNFDYEACLLGLMNVDFDPNGQMNVWLSSSANHQWNPSQKTPATPWEASIDQAMTAQSKLPGEKQRKAHFDRVQQIAYEQEPFLYLVHPDTLTAVSNRVKGAQPATLRPQVLWNVETLSIQ
jgi:peptide/nickel transport system substrate-binding protein